MINNFEQIKYRLINFENPGDCYFIQVIKRKKDNPGMGRDKEDLDRFFVYSEEEFDRLTEKIIDLCNKNNARAYIHVNKRNAQVLAIRTMQRIADLIASKQYKAVKRAYLSIAGEFQSEDKKRWIIDVDYDKNISTLEVESFIDSLKPEEPKVITIISTKNGTHLITWPFDLKTFKQKYSAIDVHKDNPTVLYIP